MDLVVNHSDEHDWFKIQAPETTYRDYYHWWPAERESRHRWSWFDVNSDAWSMTQQQTRIIYTIFPKNT
jgi:oligo-1,6-glucosidase